MSKQIKVKNTKIAKGDPPFVFEVQDVGCFVLDEVMMFRVSFEQADKKVDLTRLKNYPL